VRCSRVEHGLHELEVVFVGVKVCSKWPSIALYCDIFGQLKLLNFGQDSGVGEDGDVCSNDLVSILFISETAS